MRPCAAILLALVLAGCADLDIALPYDTTSALFRGCESAPPTGACAPGGLRLSRKWTF